MSDDLPSQDPGDAASPAGGPDAVRGVDALHPGMIGRWLVTTKRSRHIWDLDAGTYQRLPGADSQQFAHDGDPHRITRVEQWPVVGSASFIWFDDPEHPAVLEQYRISSPVRSITRLADLPMAPAPPETQQDGPYRTGPT
jgi:hypothetical protein